MHPYDRRNLEAELENLLDLLLETSAYETEADGSVTLHSPNFDRIQEDILRLFAEAYEKN